MKRLLCLLLLCGVFGIVGCGGGDAVDQPEDIPAQPGEPSGMEPPGQTSPD